MTEADIVGRLWSYCNVLRDDGLSYLEYVEQLTYLLFLKMSEERAILRREEQAIPRGCRWSDLAAVEMEGEQLHQKYRQILETLSKRSGMLGLIFRKAQNKIDDPAKLRRLIIELIGKEEWSSMDADVKGTAYEGLLEKNAQDTKGGAGQYFTPRDLIRAIVDCVRPQPGETICDPACGTGGFLLAAHDYVADPDRHALNVDQKRHLDEKALRGMELVDSVARLCGMNLLLHGVGVRSRGEDTVIAGGVDSLQEAPSTHFDVVLTNPPFGKKSSVTVVGQDGDEDRQTLRYSRTDFWTTTSNKQLNFVQHVRSLLAIPGRAAMVVPDNVLFEGGAGEKVRRRLLQECDVHTLLRLPTGIFYAQGVKANVLFFERKPAAEKAWTSRLWVYDLRTNRHFTLKQNPLKRADLDEFVSLYLPGRPREERCATWSESNPSGAWRSYSLDELLARDKLSLDLFWLRDESLADGADLPEPHVIAEEIADDLRSALSEIEAVLADLRTRAERT